MGLFGSKETSLESLLKRLQVMGIIECRGTLHSSIARPAEKIGISQSDIDDIQAVVLARLLAEGGQDKTLRRQIREAKEMFNRSSTAFAIDTDNKKAGYLFRRNKDGAIRPDDLKFDRTYETFFILALALMHLDHSADLDILTQFRALDFPLASLLFLQYCVRARRMIQFDYQNRNETPERIQNLVPVRIVLRNGHWILIGRSQEKQSWIQYMLHSIQNLSGGAECEEEIPELNIKEYFGDIWGHAMLVETEGPTEVQIQVPIDLKERVQKRRSEGRWKEGSDAASVVWEVPVFDLDDLLSYVFRWKGALKVLGPKEAVDRFKGMLRGQLEKY